MINYKDKIVIDIQQVVNDFNIKDYLSPLDNLDRIRQLDRHTYLYVKDKLIDKLPKSITVYN